MRPLHLRVPSFLEGDLLVERGMLRDQVAGVAQEAGGHSMGTGRLSSQMPSGPWELLARAAS